MFCGSFTQILNIEFKNRQQVQNNPNAELKSIKIKTDQDGFLTNSYPANHNEVDIIFFGAVQLQVCMWMNHIDGQL